MILDASSAWWWPYAVVLIAGWAMTYPWRFLGVYLGGRVSDESELLVLVRCVATALVAAVIGNLIVFPTGPAADASLPLRIFAPAFGFGVYLAARRSMLAGILAGEAAFVAGLLLGF